MTSMTYPSLAANGTTAQHRCSSSIPRNEEDRKNEDRKSSSGSNSSEERRKKKCKKESESAEERRDVARGKLVWRLLTVCCAFALSSTFWMNFVSNEEWDWNCSTLLLKQGTRMNAHTLWFLPAERGTEEEMVNQKRRITRAYASLSDMNIRDNVLTKARCLQNIERVLDEQKYLQLLIAKKHTKRASKKTSEDLCVLATLYLHGGYFLGREVNSVLTPFLFHPSSHNHQHLAAVMHAPCHVHQNTTNNKPLFPTMSFLAASKPGNPLLLEAFRLLTQTLLEQHQQAPSFSSNDGSVALSTAYHTLSSSHATNLNNFTLHAVEDATLAPTPTTKVRMLRDRHTQQVHFFLTPNTTLAKNTPTPSPSTPHTINNNNNNNKNNTNTTTTTTTTKPRFIFLMGIEGTGHHLYTTLLLHSPTMKPLKKSSLYNLQLLLFNIFKKQEGLFSAPFFHSRKKDNKLTINATKLQQKIVDQMHSIIDHYQKNNHNHNDTMVGAIPLNGMNGKPTGEMSYPNFNGEFRSLQYPDLRTLYTICTKAQVECGHVYLTRDAYNVMQSTVANRKFSPVLAQMVQLTDMLHVMEGQLWDFPQQLIGCVDYNQIETMSQPVGVEMLGYASTEEFEQEMKEIFHAKPPMTEKEKEKVVPMKWRVYMERMVGRSEKVMKTCQSIHERNREIGGGVGGASMG